VLCFFINISLGSISIPLKSVFGSLFGTIENSTWAIIINNVRLPKGLGVAIVILGSGLFGGLFATALISKWSIVIAASLGSFLVLLAVLTVSNKVRDTMAILIIGLMFGSITAAVVSVLSYFSSAEQLQNYIFWGFGSLSNLSWNELLAFCTVTAFAGPIAFIGCAIQHLMRQIFKTSNHKILLPAVFLFGAIVMLVCDSISQIPGSDYTLPINAITALIGAPVVIWLLVKQRKMMF